VNEEVVALEDVWVRYGDNTVLQEVTLKICEKDFLGIIGPNGGGKTTLLKVIMGLVQPMRGTARVFGAEPGRSWQRIGYVPQQIMLDRNFPISVRDTVLMGRLGQKTIFKGYGKDDLAVAEEALAAVEMCDYSGKQIGKLSGGQLQRVLIARALVSRPDLLLLDEPTTGIDIVGQESIYTILNRLKSMITIIIVSHDVGALAVNADKIACVGKKLYYHDSRELSSGEMEEAYRCPIELIAHGVPHRVLKEHTK
jgi:zinc transport system ATP-binding protein